MASTTENQVPSTAESRKQQAFIETRNLVTLADVKDTAIEVVKTAVQGKLEKTKAIVVEGASAVGQLLATG
ncbi:hypothetical protein OV760_30050, partial [Salmonella enterica subsp. enterica serovar 1,4,[5],12:i:-]|nr:hypothetical protein [Salmonella enterica subsp. enterica serovar 1,4,[5],12:i:-]